jgi:cyclopropane fatty-acyl-phospholipid synthase-like methyltransferase
LANETADPATHPVLDIGGGTGRDALALARRGHPVDVVEMTPKFADTIRADADRESVNVRVILRDIFTTDDDLRRDYRMIVLSEVASDFRTSQQLRAVFELATQCLAFGGRLVFNAFLSKPGYTPHDAARELGQQCYTTNCHAKLRRLGLRVREVAPARRNLAADKLVRRLGQRPRGVRSAA